MPDSIILKRKVFRGKMKANWLLVLLLCILAPQLFAKSSDFPPKPNPPRLVNDFAGMMTPDQQANLEQQLTAIAQSTSTQISIITVNSIGDYDITQYVTELGNLWGIGQKGKDNGVIIFASKNDHQLNISPGPGLQGALPDITCGQIIRNEMAPAFKQENYYLGFEKAAHAVIAATKGEYKADQKPAAPNNGFNIGGLIGLIIVVVVVLLIIRKGGGGKGGNYMSSGGGSFLTGAILGSLLGGGGGFGGGSGGGGFGGGFGGFGGGGFNGGGASGSW